MGASNMTTRKRHIKLFYILILILIAVAFFSTATLADDTGWVSASGVKPSNDPPDNSANAYQNFVDLDPALWYREGIDYVLEAGLFQGISATRFAPDQPMTRAMFVTVLHRMEGLPDGYGNSPFFDVGNGMWYTAAVIWANDKGIVKGYNDTAFGPNDYLTREQMVAILYRYAIYKGYNLSASEHDSIFSYVDYDSISDYAILPMQWAFRTTLIEGMNASTLNPKGLITRAQAATIIMRFYKNVVK